MSKTVNQLLRRTRVNLPLKEKPPGFRRHNWLLVTGNADTNVWVRTKPSIQEAIFVRVPRTLIRFTVPKGK